MKPLRLFGREEANKPANATPKQYAPGTQLAYDPELPQRLQQQHRNIETVLEEMLAAAEDGRYRQANNLLRDFRQQYEGHLYEKKQRFIPYLNHCLAGSDKHSTLTLKISAVSRQLEHRVMAAVRPYEQDGISGDNHAHFSRELRDIQKDLLRHMQEKEQFIYPMYQPPQA
ncbi:MAG TPA: hemerythrin domain-containing protein [Gammaproteobacteria bacterium]|nr:hemerythrin domain-containing protein [Gammaproteobacteria bacterium]